MSRRRIYVDAAVTPAGLTGPVSVTIVDGQIEAIEAIEATEATDAVDAVDAVESGVERLRGTLAPGFVDLQVNGIGPVDVARATADGWDELDRALLDQGVTTWCPTLISAPLDAYADRLAAIEAAAARPGRRPHIAGAHMEGPFLAVAGAHDPEVIGAPDPVWLDGLVDRFGDVVRIVTLAPELAGGIDAVRALSERGVLVAIGHTAADHRTVIAAAAAGARLVTHVFNAMTGIHHREPGPVTAALTCDDLTVSVIADGQHLHPAIVDLIRRSKGPDRCILVTDQIAAPAVTPAATPVVTAAATPTTTPAATPAAMSPAAMSPAATGRHRSADDSGSEPSPAGEPAPRTASGVLAGSRLRMDEALAMAAGPGGFGLVQAVRAASTTPARLLGLDDRGTIEPGRRADLVLLDTDLRASRTWLAEDWTGPGPN